MAYCTTADVRTYLGITGTGDDALIGDLITRAQAAIDARCRRTFEASSDSTRTFDVSKDTEDSTLWLDDDLAQITTVTTNADNGSGGSEITSSEYVAYPRNDTPYNRIKILGSSTQNWEATYDNEMGITVAGRWAYSVTAPDDIAQACIRLASFYYRQKDAALVDVTAIEQGVVIKPLGIPADVRSLLWPYVRR